MKRTQPNNRIEIKQIDLGWEIKIGYYQRGKMFFVQNLVLDNNELVKLYELLCDLFQKQKERTIAKRKGTTKRRA